jgi:hypothetical protein
MQKPDVDKGRVRLKLLLEEGGSGRNGERRPF